MLLSVIIPVYNAESQIYNCLDCLLKQDLQAEEYEILVMDDGSLDSTYSIVQEYVDRYKNIKIFKQDNQGPGAARNALIKEASGEYVYFIDADDLLVYNSLGVLAREAKRLSLDIISFDSKTANTIEEFNQNISTEIPTGLQVMDGYKFFEKNPAFRLEVWWYLVKTSFIKENSLCFGFGKYNKDVLFTLNAFVHAKRLVHVRQVFHCYLQSEGSIMRSKEFAHRRILLDNFHTMIQDFSEFIARLDKNSIANYTSIIQCLESRRNSLIWYFLAKLVRSGLKADEAKAYIKRLKAIEVYPIRVSNSSPFSTLKKMAVIVLNREYFLLPTIELTAFQYNLRYSA